MAIMSGLLFLGALLLGHWGGIGLTGMMVGAAGVGAMVFWGGYCLVMHLIRVNHQLAGRIAAAAKGDLLTPVPRPVHQTLPAIADATETLFRKIRDNIENVQTLAMVDSLTGLANRVSFCRQVEGLMAASGPGGSGAMIFIDLDGFKAVNDRLGHAAGDQVLTSVAGRLREIVVQEMADGAAHAVLGRFAGDEFTLFLPDVESTGLALRVAHSIRQGLENPFETGGSRAKIGASVGIACYPAHGKTLTSLLRSADHAMYDAKHGGRGQVRLYSTELEQRITGRAEQERDLRQAIERNEFILRFQPQMDIASRRIACAEALIRWDHPYRKGLMTPDGFLDLAEETGLIVEMGDWVLNQICQTAGRWAAMGVGQHISMNISGRELAQADFTARMLAAMRRYAVPHGRLKLEVSEALMMSLRPEDIAKLAHLHDAGVSMIIDDFGKGFSNISRLRALPIDGVKIDRKVVRDIVVSTEARTICAAIIGLVKGLELPIVAEGVEKREQITLLHAMGCNAFQGYCLSRPVSERVYLARFSDMPAEGVRA